MKDAARALGETRCPHYYYTPQPLYAAVTT